MLTRTAITLSLTAILPLATGCIAVHNELYSPGINDYGDTESYGTGDETEGNGDEGNGNEGGGDDDGNGEGIVAPRPDGGMCEAHVTKLLAGQHIDSGTVTVSSDADSLLISIDTTAPHLLTDVHIYAGIDEVPVNAGGNPTVGLFPYPQEMVEPMPNATFVIPLAELGASCGDKLNIAAHATVVAFDEAGNEVLEETAWGFGDESFDGMRWGWSFDYATCCP